MFVSDAGDRPGAAAVIFRRIADAGVNVHFTHLATNNRMVVGAGNLQKVKELLSKENPSTGRT